MKHHGAETEVPDFITIATIYSDSVLTSISRGKWSEIQQALKDEVFDSVASGLFNGCSEYVSHLAQQESANAEANRDNVVIDWQN